MTKQEFNEYVQAQGADILRFCRMTTASKIEGDELYQDTMLKLLEQLQHLNVDKNLKSYTLSVAIFLWKNQRRKYARRKRLASFESYEAQDESGNLKVISADTKTPEQTVVQNETNGAPSAAVRGACARRASSRSTSLPVSTKDSPSSSVGRATRASTAARQATCS